MRRRLTRPSPARDSAHAARVSAVQALLAQHIATEHGEHAAARVQVGAASAQHARLRNDRTRIPRATGPATGGARPHRALPPPHVYLTPRDREHAQRSAVQAMRRATEHGLREERARLPQWAYLLATRCHDGREERELCMLPPERARQLRAAMDAQRTEHARRSVCATGVVLYWLSVRQPTRIGLVSSVAGLSHGCLRQLTKNRNGKPYSKSTVGNGAHGRGTEGRLGPRKGVRGDMHAGDAGHIEALTQAGFLRSWVPPAGAVPAWMRGAVYAFCIYRLTEEPLAPVARAPERMSLTVLGCTFYASDSDPPPF